MEMNPKSVLIVLIIYITVFLQNSGFSCQNWKTKTYDYSNFISRITECICTSYIE